MIIIVILVRLYHLYSTQSYSTYNYLTLRAKEYKADRQIEKSKEMLLEAIKEEPEETEAYIILADVFIAEKNYADAEEIFYKVLDKNPNNEEAMRMLIDLYEKNANYGELKNLIKEYRANPVFSKNEPKMPVCDKQSGEYENKISIVLKSLDSGKILYTIDGSEPDYTSSEYVDPILLGKGSHIIKAVNIVGGIKSETLTLEYFILNDYEIINFENKEFELAVRNYLAKDANPIIDSDIEKIYSMLIMGENIFFNVEDVKLSLENDLSGYAIEDVSFIQNGEKNEFLNIQNGDFGGIYDLSNFKNLKEIYIYCQTEVDLSFLQYLEKLEKISIGHNSNIANINFLKKPENLRKLEIRDNGTDMLYILPTLTELELLDISYNHLKNLDFIYSLEDLKVLDLSNNDLENISELANLKKLEILNLDNNKISDIEPISDLENLKEISIENNIVLTNENKFHTRSLNRSERA